jgi:fructose-bisphosphate aldolase, class I
MSAGKTIRLGRFRYSGTNVGLIVPIDHGLTIGPVDGLKSTSQISDWVGHGAICGVIAHKGIVERLADRGALSTKGVMIHLNGMSVLGAAPNTKELLTSVENAVHLGADAVSVQVNFDGANDAHNLRLLGAVVDDAHRFEVPVLTMVYDKCEPSCPDARVARARHLMRIAIELGTDALKIAAPPSIAELPELFDGLADDVPIYVAGGSLVEETAIVELARQTVLAGGAGLCAGRNIFQRASHRLLTRLRDVLIESALDLTAATTGTYRRVNPLAGDDHGAAWASLG